MSETSRELAGLTLAVYQLVESQREATAMVDEHWKQLHKRADEQAAREVQWLGHAKAHSEFARLVLRAWWSDGELGDVDGADLQEFAQKAGLWRQVMEGEHGPDCEACGGDGSPCSELTEAGLALLGVKP